MTGDVCIPAALFSLPQGAAYRRGYRAARLVILQDILRRAKVCQRLRLSMDNWRIEWGYPKSRVMAIFETMQRDGLGDWQTEATPSGLYGTWAWSAEMVPAQPQADTTMQQELADLRAELATLRQEQHTPRSRRPSDDPAYRAAKREETADAATAPQTENAAANNAPQAPLINLIIKNQDSDSNLINQLRDAAAEHAATEQAQMFVRQGLIGYGMEPQTVDSNIDKHGVVRALEVYAICSQNAKRQQAAYIQDAFNKGRQAYPPPRMENTPPPIQQALALLVPAAPPPPRLVPATETRLAPLRAERTCQHPPPRELMSSLHDLLDPLKKQLPLPPTGTG